MQNVKTLTNKDILKLEAQAAQNKIDEIKKRIANDGHENKVPVVAQTDSQTIEIN